MLSKLALKDAMVELEATVRKQSDVYGSALLQIRQQAEKRLGVEVDIDDPALRGLFRLHVLAVEELCNRVRAHAEVTLESVEAWSQCPLGATAAGLRLLGGSDERGGDAGEAIGAELADADRATAEARARLASRIQAEVLGAMDERLREHARIREDVRERQRLQASAVAARRDLAWLRKSAVGASGLKALSGRPASGPIEEAEARSTESILRVAALDERLLERLTQLAADSVEAARRPWAALMQIQVEFFTSQQATYISLVDPFEEFGQGSGQGHDAPGSPVNADCFR